MFKLLVVGLGGFVGAVSRYGISGLVQRYHKGAFPLGTFTVNVLGCLLIGVLMTLVQDREALSANTRLFLTVGLLGSLTTFSTLGHETLELLRENNLQMALGSVLGNVVVGVAAVGLGRAAVKSFGG